MNYKDWQLRYEARHKGLGDTIDRITELTGIKKLIKSVFKDCGCESRRKLLNKWVKYKTVMELTEKEYIYLHNWFEREGNKKKPVFNENDRKELFRIRNRIFKSKKPVSNCTGCLRDLNRELKSIFYSK